MIQEVAAILLVLWFSQLLTIFELLHPASNFGQTMGSKLMTLQSNSFAKNSEFSFPLA